MQTQAVAEQDIVFEGFAVQAETDIFFAALDAVKALEFTQYLRKFKGRIVQLEFLVFDRGHIENIVDDT